MPTFSELRTAAYCTRKYYYDRQREHDPPGSIEPVRALAFRYDELLSAPDAELADLPIEPVPSVYRANLVAARRSIERWDQLCDPPRRNALLRGRDCRGIAHKVLEDPPTPVYVSPGTPPARGVWTGHSVVAVAAGLALAWEHETPVERAIVEYPAHGVVRPIELTSRRRGAYRRVLRAIREVDGPPTRTRRRSKCSSCRYAAECGVRTRTLRSLLKR